MKNQVHKERLLESWSISADEWMSWFQRCSSRKTLEIVKSKIVQKIAVNKIILLKDHERMSYWWLKKHLYGKLQTFSNVWSWWTHARTYHKLGWYLSFDTTIDRTSGPARNIGTEIWTNGQSDNISCVQLRYVTAVAAAMDIATETR